MKSKCSRNKGTVTKRKEMHLKKKGSLEMCKEKRDKSSCDHLIIFVELRK